MLQQLVTQFIASGAANDTIAQVTQQTDLDENQAREAVQATAEGTAEAAGDGGLADIAGSLLGGGGLGGLAGSLLGGGQPAAGQQTGGAVPPALAQTVTQIVAQKTGLSPAIAGVVVGLALPKILEFFSPDGDGEQGGGGGGLLGGLLGG